MALSSGQLFLLFCVVWIGGQVSRSSCWSRRLVSKPSFETINHAGAKFGDAASK